jgi:hypothetical protein
LRAREPPEMPLKAAAVTADVQLAILSGEGLAASCGIWGGREMRDVVLCTEYRFTT